MRDNSSSPPPVNLIEGVEVEQLLLLGRQLQSMTSSNRSTNSFDELGSPGLKVFSGIVQQAYNAELRWPSAFPIYNRIRRTDPEIAGIVRPSFVAWSRKCSLELELPDNPTDDDKRLREFGFTVFDELEGGFSAFVETLVSYVPFMGWGWFEVPFGRRDGRVYGETWRSKFSDGVPVPRKIAFRDHSSFLRWEFSPQKKLLGMWQQDPPTVVFLPLERSLHITFGDPNNPEGLTPLEAVWRLERTKYALELIFGIGAEHTAGHLSVKTELRNISPSDQEYVRAAANAVLSASQGNFALWPKGFQGELQASPFNAADSILRAINYYSLLKLQVYALHSVAIATTSGVGSYSAAETATDMALLMFNGMMEGFANQIDSQLGPRIFDSPAVREMFPGATRRPRIKFTPIEKQISLSELADFVQTVFPLMPVGDDDWASVRRASGVLPETSPKTEVRGEQPVVEPENLEGTVPVEASGVFARRPFSVAPDENPTSTEQLISTLTESEIDRITAEFLRWASEHAPRLADAVSATVLESSTKETAFALLSSFEWDASNGEYRSQDRPVSTQSLLDDFEKYLHQKILPDLRELTEKMIDGTLSLPEWQVRGAQVIKEGWVNALHIGRGGKEVTTLSDYGRIGGRLRAEYRRWDQFAREIKGGTLSTAQILDRVSKYGQGPRTAFFDGRTAAKKSAGFLFEVRHLDPGAQHCDDCLRYASLGPQPLGTLPEPGDQCQCNRRCRCSKEYLRTRESQSPS